MPTLKELDQKLTNLKLRRYQIECSDDFAYTNGKIAKIDSQINDINKQIDDIQNDL